MRLDRRWQYGPKGPGSKGSLQVVAWSANREGPVADVAMPMVGWRTAPWSGQ